MKMKQTSAIALFAASCALFATASVACASKTDVRIESSARNSYVFKTLLKNDSVKTVSTDGVVALTGTVSTEAHKALAQDTVEDLPGVVSVDNKLVVTEAPEEYSDSWVAVKINTVLMFHSNVSASSTKVTVNDGVVTLNGEASSLAQKELTTEYAKDVEGVKKVINEMTIAKTSATIEQTTSEKIDDASITAQVKVLLASHHSTSAIKTGIHTMVGVVTVTGVAKNDAEISLVSKLIKDVNGVTKVINNMTVEVAVPARAKS